MLVDHPEDFQCDVESTIKPATFRLSSVKKIRDFDTAEDDQINDTLVPAHLRVVGIHGNGASGVGFHGDNVRAKAGVQIEDQVVGIPDNNNYSINDEQTSSVSALSSRRSGTLPELKIGKYFPTELIHPNITPQQKVCSDV